MFRQLTTRRITAIAIVLCAAGVGAPAWAQHGSSGGYFDGSGHAGFGLPVGGGHNSGAGHHASADHGYRTHGYLHDDHHYSPSHLSLYYGSGYGYYGSGYYGSGYYADSSRSRYGYDYGSPYTFSAPAGGCGSRAYYARTDPVVRTARSGCCGGRSTAVTEPPRPGPDYQRGAEEAFRAERYDQSLRLGNHALVETPGNGKLHLFVSQLLFATGDYPRAAAAIHEGTSLLEPKDWGYVVQNYPHYYSSDAYVKQMDRLAKFVQENPNAAYARLLRGYHFGFLGHKEAARRDLAKAVELESRDQLAARLLEMFAGETLPDPADPEDAGDLPKAVAKDQSTSGAADDVHPHDEHGQHQH